MKNSKRPARSEKNKGTRVEGYSGHWVESNIWFKLGLSKSEAAMLKAVAERIFKVKGSSAEAARLLLQAALAHFKDLWPLIVRAETYRRNEGFTSLDHCLQGKVRQQHAHLVKCWSTPAKK